MGLGANAAGQLGNGTNTSSNTPVEVSGGGNNWIAIAAGSEHTVALKSDGTLWAWGYNVQGQLGNGTLSDSNTPVEVSGGDDTWTAIAAGGYQTRALKSDGTLWWWGSSGTGFGSGNPAQVGSDNDWTAIAAGFDHTVALKSNGDLWAWGWNQYGQLGDGTNETSADPVQVSGGGHEWVAIAAGPEHTVALKSDGTLWAWGYNLQGQLGDGTVRRTSNTPVQDIQKTITGLPSPRGSHTVALKSNGDLWAWGWNQYGQLGDGTNTHSSIPLQTPITIGSKLGLCDRG